MDKGFVFKDNKPIRQMRKFNQSDYDLVNKYESDFRRAIDSRYAKGIFKEEFDVISKVYKETLNRQANSSCGGCVLQMLTSVGRLYFAFKKEMDEQLKKEEETKKTTKLRSRRKKEDKENVQEDKTEV